MRRTYSHRLVLLACIRLYALVSSTERVRGIRSQGTGIRAHLLDR